MEELELFTSRHLGILDLVNIELLDTSGQVCCFRHANVVIARIGLGRPLGSVAECRSDYFQTPLIKPVLLDADCDYCEIVALNLG